MDKYAHRNFFPFFKSKLAIRLSLYIFSLAIMIALLLGVADVVRKYQIKKEAIQKEFVQIEKTNTPAIKENLWILNISSLKTILNGLLQKPDFIYFKLSDEDGETLIEVGTPVEKNDKDILVKKVPLYHTDSYNQRTYLGSLTMVATTKNIQKEILHNALSTLGILLITMLLVAFSIIMLIWFFITKHLFKIKNYTDEIRFDKEMPPLQLDRKENYWTRNDVLSSLVDAFNKMQNTIQNSYKKLEFQSFHEPLTDLPNRRSLKIDLANRIEECRQSGKYAALYFIDLDFFKVFNDSLGHNAGDAILIEVASRLKTLEDRGVKVYRLGGDEFLILSEPLSQDKEEAKQKALELVDQIRQLFDKHITIEEKTIKLTTSIGIELFKDAKNVETVIKHADNALYQAKKEGRNRFAFFHMQMQSDADKRLQTEQILQEAIQKDAFITYFQPKFDKKRRVISAETLIRLQNSDGKVIPPGEFIPLAQETGMILEIDRLIIRKVFEFIVQNRKKIEESTLKSIAINISPNQFIMETFPDFIISEARRLDIDPSFIILEITEEAVVSNVEYALEIMNILKKYGFRFSIDDFGTGYSSMRYLMNFPLYELKIDKSFVDHILDNERNAAVVQTIITLAQNLHLNVVAEGVETKEQLEAILRYGDVLIQGYLFSPPLPKEKFLQLLSEAEK